MKIIATTPDKKFFKLGENDQNSYWYATAEVSKFINNLKKGDDVEIKYRKNAEKKNELTFIKKVGGSPEGPEETGPEPSSAPNPQIQKYSPHAKPGSSGSYGKFDPATQASIKRQAIGNMTSRTLIALQGQVTVENIEGEMERIYKKYVELVG